MLSRFDICMAQLKTSGAKTPSQTIGDQNGADGDQPDAKPVDPTQPKKNHPKHGDKNHA
jgi:hypothetical protein